MRWKRAPASARATISTAFSQPKPVPPRVARSGGALYEAVVDALKEIYDPEIPVNIYDLGLIYGVEIADSHAVVTMTLTTPHCPVAESMPGEIELRVGAVPGVGISRSESRLGSAVGSAEDVRRGQARTGDAVL
jgi:metal-sulfur cluster biosynthetic enzyme